MPKAFIPLVNVLCDHMRMPHIYYGVSDKRLIQLQLNNSLCLQVPHDALGSNSHMEGQRKKQEYSLAKQITDGFCHIKCDCVSY